MTDGLEIIHRHLECVTSFLQVFALLVQLSLDGLRQHWFPQRISAVKLPWIKRQCFGFKLVECEPIKIM